MSYTRKIHGKEFTSKYTRKLQQGDILFTTTSGKLSSAIKFIANTPISHVNLYTGNEKLIENTDGVKESSIHKEFQTSKCTRLIAYRHKKTSKKDKRNIVKAARKYTGRVWDGEQALFHALTSNSAHPLNMLFDLVPGRRTATLAIKRSVVGTLTNWTSPKRRQPLMCSTLAVYSYLDAGIKINMTNVIFAGTDDLYHHCKTNTNFKKLFDLSFTKTGIAVN